VRRKLRLVPRGGKDAQREELIACIEEALQEAKDGSLEGWCGVKRYKGGEWDRNNCGRTYTDPVWTSSMLMAFAIKLSSEINEA
jgi:hypothetical protein